MSARQTGREAPAGRHPGDRRVDRQLAAAQLLHGRRTRPRSRRPLPVEPGQPDDEPRREHRRNARGRRPQLRPPRPHSRRTARRRVDDRRRRPHLARTAAGQASVHRRANRLPQSPRRPRARRCRCCRQPVPGLDRRPDPHRCVRLGLSRRPDPSGGAGVAGRSPEPPAQRAVRSDVRRCGDVRSGHRGHRRRVHRCRALGDTSTVAVRHGGAAWRGNCQRRSRRRGGARCPPRRVRPSALGARAEQLGVDRLCAHAQRRRLHPSDHERRRGRLGHRLQRGDRRLDLRSARRCVQAASDSGSIRWPTAWRRRSPASTASASTSWRAERWRRDCRDA